MLFEVLTRLAIHPAQYSLVGLALATFFLLLISEDNALLQGSVLVFGLVAAAMIVTRRLDWYAVGTARAAAV